MIQTIAAQYPTACSNLCNKIFWSTVGNVALMSYRAKTDRSTVRGCKTTCNLGKDLLYIIDTSGKPNPFLSVLLSWIDLILEKVISYQVSRDFDLIRRKGHRIIKIQ